MSRGRVARLMRRMGIEAVYRRTRTSLPGNGDEHKVYPYLLGGREVGAADEVWCTDITYIPMGRGFAYLVAVMDWGRVIAGPNQVWCTDITYIAMEKGYM